MTAKIVPARVPLVDPRTGLITREWYLLFQNFFELGGGLDNDLATLIAPAITVDAFAAASERVRDELGMLPPDTPAPRADDDVRPPTLPAAPPPDDLAPPPLPLLVPLDDVLPVIGALRDEIAVLRARIDDMAKGGPIL